MALSMDKIIGIALGVYVLAALIPSALTTFFGANTTGWDTATVALWGIIPLAIVILVVRSYFAGGGGGRS